MLAKARAVAFACICLAAVVAAASAQTPDARIRTERLAALGRLWGAVKFFHPYLATKSIEWDAALIAALPKVRAATSAAEYRAAVDGMLAALNDPATRTIEVGDDRATPRAEPSRIVEDVLVLDCVAMAEHLANGDYSVGRDVVAAYLRGKRKGVVFDCRAPTAWIARRLGFWLGYVVRDTLSAVLHQPVTLGTTRQRQHSGYEPQVGPPSGGYRSGLVTDLPGVLAGRAAGEQMPLAFLINARTPDLSAVLAGLRDANVAWIVEETQAGQSNDQGNYVRLMELPDDAIASMRVAELVTPSGELGLRPDIKVPASPGEDAALNAAIKSLSAPPPPRSAVSPSAAFPNGSHDNPYGEMALPDPNYRLLALFRFWNVIHYFYPHRDLMDRDWGSALAEFIPRFEQNRSRLDYEMTVAALAHRLQDSHVGLSGAREFNDSLGLYAPPLTVQTIEGQTVIMKVHDAAAASGLSVGDVILAVDGEPVAARRARLEELFAASTPQAMRALLDRHVLRGGKDTAARLRVRSEGGVERDVLIGRTSPRDEVAYSPARTTPSVYQILPSGFGYIDLARLTQAEADRAIDALIDTPAIVFDMRGYPKGTFYLIAPRLLKGDRPVVTAQIRRPFQQGTEFDLDGPPARHDFAYTEITPPSDKPRYKGKVVMLINEQAVSQSEQTCATFEAVIAVTFIGSPTAGANGDVTNLVLPGGLSVSFTGNDFRRANGRQLQRVGIQPDIRVEPTIKGIREGRDEVLEAAVKFLQERR